MEGKTEESIFRRSRGRRPNLDMKSALLKRALERLSLPDWSISVQRSFGSLAGFIAFGRERVEPTSSRKEGIGGSWGALPGGEDFER